MADSGKVLLVVGAAGFAWWQGWLAPLGIPGPGSAPAPTPGQTQPTTVQPGTSAASTPAPPTPPPPPAPSVKLADLYSTWTNLISTAQAAAAQSGGAHPLGPDEYDYFLVQAFQAKGLPDPGLPDPVQLFGPAGWNRGDFMTAAAYWASMSDWLAKNKGLSGFRGYAGLAGIARQHGWGF